jgi:hypothetical protein
MMRPFMSSLASSTTVTVVSAVWLAATRWSASGRTSDRACRGRGGLGGAALRPGPPPRLGASLLFHLADRSLELVTNEILGSLEHRRLRLSEGHARDALELVERVLADDLQLVL